MLISKGVADVDVGELGAVHATAGEASLVNAGRLSLRADFRRGTRAVGGPADEGMMAQSRRDSTGTSAGQQQSAAPAATAGSTEEAYSGSQQLGAAAAAAMGARWSRR